jgi:deoxyribonuclease V
MTKHSKAKFAKLIARWPTTIAEARDIQIRLHDQVITEDSLPKIHYVAGVDVGFEDKGKTTRAAVAVLNFPQLELVEESVVRLPTAFPYIPGYLSFRELPGILAALAKLTRLPDLILCDGQGIAHPRRFGLACHLGVLINRPTIGVAKSRLIGEYQGPGQHKGAWSPLIDKEELVGAVLRTRDNVNPLFISSGHRISLTTAIDFVLACTTRYRLPETTRQAHKLASA